jgi:hypothetical protein
VAWTTIAALAGFAVSIAPGVLWAINHFQTVANAKLHQASDARTFAWVQAQGMKNEVTMMRNRVNDCDIRQTKPGPMSDLERAACKQYVDEFNEASRRFVEARNAAAAASKERP